MPYTVNTGAGEVGTPLFALTASTVEQVSISLGSQSVRIWSDGAAAVWYTTDGSTPAVDGPKSWYLPAAPWAVVHDPTEDGAIVFKFISAGTPKLRVERTW